MISARRDYSQNWEYVSLEKLISLTHNGSIRWHQIVGSTNGQDHLQIFRSCSPSCEVKVTFDENRNGCSNGRNGAVISVSNAGFSTDATIHFYYALYQEIRRSIQIAKKLRQLFEAERVSAGEWT
jgi:hypothetical protein